MEDKLRAKEGFKSTKWMPREAKIPSPTSMCNFSKCRFINTYSQTWEREETYKGAVNGNLLLSYGFLSTAGRENSVRNGWYSHDITWRVTNRLPLLFVPLCISAFRTRASTGQYNEHWITGKRRIFFSSSKLLIQTFFKKASLWIRYPLSIWTESVWTTTICKWFMSAGISLPEDSRETINIRKDRSRDS